MAICEQFAQLVRSLSDQRAPEEKARVCVKWLETITLDSVADALDVATREDREEVVRRVTANPPAIVEIASTLGWSLQLICWYPLDGTSMSNYDSEDIHSHFGFIASKGLSGCPYRASEYRVKGDSVEEVRQYDFTEGMTSIISPDDVHSVRHVGQSVGLSIRINLPLTRGAMKVFDNTTGRLKSTITANRERQRVDLAATLSAVDRERFSRHIQELHASCLGEESRKLLEVLGCVRGT